MSKFVNSKENNNKLASIMPSTVQEVEKFFRRTKIKTRILSKLNIEKPTLKKSERKEKRKPKTNIFDIVNENLFNIGNFLMTNDFKNLWESINFVNTPYLDALREFFVDKMNKLKLDLSKSDIKDVRALSRLYKLNLSGCKNITDVSALKKVYELDLSYCHNIKDFSAFDISNPIKYFFEKIERIDKDHKCKIEFPLLDIKVADHESNTSNAQVPTDSSHSTDSVEGEICSICYEEFKKNDEFEIRYIKLRCNHNFCEKCIRKWYDQRGRSCPLCRVSILPTFPVFLKTIIHTIILRGCNSVTNDSLYHLKWVHTLDLSDCRKISNVRALGEVHTLTLSSCHKIRDVSALGGVHTLNLSYCDNITVVSALGGVHTLYLCGCYKITDVSALGGPNQHTLMLSRCYNITDVSALGGVHTLDLSYCYEITDVSTLGGPDQHTLDLSWCWNITDESLRDLVNVPNLILLSPNFI